MKEVQSWSSQTPPVNIPFTTKGKRNTQKACIADNPNMKTVHTTLSKKIHLISSLILCIDREENASLKRLTLRLI